MVKKIRFYQQQKQHLCRSDSYPHIPHEKGGCTIKNRAHINWISTIKNMRISSFFWAMGIDDMDSTGHIHHGICFRMASLWDSMGFYSGKNMG